MKKILYILIFIFSQSTTGLLIAEEVTKETIEFSTYYPAPYGAYEDIRADIYRDLEDTDDGVDDPNNYYLDLNNRCRINFLALGITDQYYNTYKNLLPDESSPYSYRNATLHVGDPAIGMRWTQTMQYFDKDDYCSLYSYSKTTAANIYAIYSESRINGSSRNIGILGEAGGSSAMDYGAFGYSSDTNSVIGKGDMFGVIGYFGKDADDIQLRPLSGGIERCGVLGIGGTSSPGVYGFNNTSYAAYYYTPYYFNSSGGYFIGESGARGLLSIATGEDGVGITGISLNDSEFSYGGYFDARWLPVGYPGTFIQVRASGYTPEILGSDSDLFIKFLSLYGCLKLITPASNLSEPPGSPTATKNNAWLNVSNKNSPGSYIALIADYNSDTTHVRARNGNVGGISTNSGNIVIEPGIDHPDQNALIFVGNVKVYVRESELVHPPYTPPSDIAEVFELSDYDGLESGDVVVIDENNPMHLKKSSEPCDHKVAGVISDLSMASFVIGLRDNGSRERPLAIAGRVYCKVDADYGEIKPGDLLVTSPTPGHAMKTRPVEIEEGLTACGQGVILGKALEPLSKGKGKILILVCLM